MNTRTSMLATLLVAMFFSSCSPAELSKTLGDVLGGTGTQQLTSQEIVGGLKEALTQGISKGSDIVSAVDGYYKNNAIKILFPPEAQKIEQKLQQIGLGNLTEQLVEKVNHAAEDAAKGAKPIFKKAITDMTINDGLNILMGEDDAATTYLKKTTYDGLYNSFKPVIVNSLNKKGALDSWTDVVTKYNKIPVVQKMNPDLADHVTSKALNGLFYMITKEEKLIRKDPVARVTDLLKKVFAKQDNK